MTCKSWRTLVTFGYKKVGPASEFIVCLDQKTLLEFRLAARAATTLKYLKKVVLTL